MKKFIVANWKCNPTSQREAKRLLGALKRELKKRKGRGVEVVVCPPFVYLPLAVDFLCTRIKSQLFRVGAQDVFWQNKGAFTGEISPMQIKDLGVKYVLVGHSERDLFFGENNETAANKIKALLKVGLNPILCVGETIKQRSKGKTFEAIEAEVKGGLRGIAKSQIKEVIVAYEPIWAIGTGNNCSLNDALTASLFIRKVIGKLYTKKICQSIRVLYGGSIKADNASDYLQSDWIDGLLIGEASLEPKEFLEIISRA